MAARREAYLQLFFYCGKSSVVGPVHNDVYFALLHLTWARLFYICLAYCVPADV